MPEWWLRLKDGRGWIPYRIPDGLEPIVEPAGDINKLVLTRVESLIGNYGHKITFGLLVKKSVDGNDTVWVLQSVQKEITLQL